ncbi:MAG: hypothetical protein KJ063_03455 [Anaerolineae bacterium]|nr:hypothetical protein [Anaerolineae bacterium]
MIRIILEFIVLFLLILFVATLSVGIVIGWSLLLAWPLSRWLPISLGEGAILTSIASFIATLVWYRILDLGRPSVAPIQYVSSEENEDDDGLWYEEDYPIPSQRFAPTHNERTGENWLRYDLANELALAIDDTPAAKGLMNEKQIHELAIRLSNMIVTMVKDKPEVALHINLPTLKKQMSKMGLSPYDDAILRVTLQTWKEEIDYPEVRELIYEQLWDDPW